MPRHVGLIATGIISTLGLFAAIGGGDQEFATKAAQGGMAEVQLGRLAAGKASNQKVKDFGQRMVDDHSKAGDQLKRLAASEHISLPPDISAEDKALIRKLSSLSGKAFDKAYMTAMVKDHKTDISEFQSEAKTGTDSGLKNFAETTLPTLKQHLELAKEAASAVGAH